MEAVETRTGQDKHFGVGQSEGGRGHEESHGQCPGQYSGEVWLQKSPCPAIVVGAQPEKRCEEALVPRPGSETPGAASAPWT